MIHKNFNFSVNIRAGLNGPILQEYDSEEGRVSRSIEAVTDTILCTQITLHKDFEWFDADGLYVGIRYGSRDYQIELWIPKDLATPSSDENKWSLQIPGTNILDTATNRSMGCRYRFAELETWQCDKMYSEQCLDLRQGNEQYLGTIWVSIKRRKVKHGSEPTAIKDNKASKPPLKMCQHSAAVLRADGVKHTVKTERVASFNMNGMIPNPKLDELTDIDAEKHHNHFMNSVFLFRSKEQLSRVMKNQEKSDSDEPRAEGSMNPPKISHRDNKTSKASKTTDTVNPVTAKNTKKRFAESSPSPIADTSKKTKREKVPHAGLTKEGLRSRSSDPVPEQSTAVPKLSSVLNEEYRKLGAAGNAQRRSKSKHARVSSGSSTRSDQPATSGAPVAQKTRAQPSSASKNARRSRSISISSDSNQSRQSNSPMPSVPEKELNGPESRNSTRRNGNLTGTGLEIPLRTVELDAKPATSEREIKALREKKERLQERLKQKLEAECEELERQLKE